MSLAARFGLGSFRSGAAKGDVKSGAGAETDGASPMGKKPTSASQATTQVLGPNGEISPLSEYDSPYTPGYGCFRDGPDGSDDGSSETCTSPAISPAGPRGGKAAPSAPIPEEAEGEDDRPPPPGLVDPQNLPSPGSATHGLGCRPCAWFHKPQGCQNGAECRHCHLCPDGEIKARKKVKVDTMRSDTMRSDMEDDDSEEADIVLQEPLKVTSTLASPPASSGKSVLDLPPPPGLPAPKPGSLDDDGDDGELPSAGSTVHGSGDCKPCAWFYKAQGCANGMDCRHCHLCPEGEIRSRRKVKVATLRKKGTDEDLAPTSRMDQALWQQAAQHQAQEAAMLAAATWEAQAIAAQWEAQAAAVQWEAAAAAAQAAEAAAQVDASPYSPSAAATMDFLASSATSSGAMPSAGSALHQMGRCRPCAWFWKAQGCLNGQECAHCHLCPEGELKERKRMKETAMRMGALLPATPGHNSRAVGSPSTQSGRSPCVVQIAPILGA